MIKIIRILKPGNFLSNKEDKEMFRKTVIEWWDKKN